jgi:hypothetical protein
MRRTIYVKDEDAGLFEEAEALGEDSISAVLAEALRKWLADRKADAQGWQIHEIIPAKRVVDGTTPDEFGRPVKFRGRLLATVTRGSLRDGGSRTTWRAYVTQAGKIVVHRDHETVWQGACNEDSVSIYETLPDVEKATGEFPGDVPEELVVEVAKALGEDPALWVD